MRIHQLTCVRHVFGRARKCDIIAKLLFEFAACMCATSNCLRCAGESRKRITVPDVGLTLLVEAAVEQIGRSQHALRVWIAELKLSAFVEISSCVSSYQVTSRTGMPAK